MGGRQLMTLDTLPLKRVLALEESGTEHFPPEPTQEEKPRLLLQRLDFGHSLENDAKKAKNTKEAVSPRSAWPWQGLVEQLQQAHQELSIILDFLTHVETNEAVTVASMVKPKPLLHEACSDLALRASVKLHYFKKVGKHLKQNAKALEHQVEREAIFYGALMRLQRNWKIKRLRGISAGPGGSAGFSVDLSYPFPTDIMSGLPAQTTALYTVNIEQDSTGLLAVHLPGRHINALQLHFCGPHATLNVAKDAFKKNYHTVSCTKESKSESGSEVIEQENTKCLEKGVGEGVDEGARVAQSVLRCIQTAIFDEQIYEWVAKEALQPSSGVIVTGICDNGLQLGLGHSTALAIELMKVDKETNDQETTERNSDETDQNDAMQMDLENATQTQETVIDSDIDKMSERQKIGETQLVNGQLSCRSVSLPHESSAKVGLLETFFQSTLMQPHVQDAARLSSKSGPAKMLEGSMVSSKPRESGTWTGIGSRDPLSTDTGGPLKHFSATMRHRVCCYKVFSELEKLVRGVPHLCLFFHPTWHPLVTAWELRLDIPQTVALGWKMRQTSWSSGRQKSKLKFHCTVVLRDDSILVEYLEPVQMQGAVKEEQQMSKYNCGFFELPGFLLHQIAGQLITWLHEEALAMGLKVRRDLLSIFFHLSGQDAIAVVASLDVKACCINWWLLSLSATVEDGHKEEVSSPTQSKRFLGPLPLETLRGIVVDLLNLCEEDS